MRVKFGFPENTTRHGVLLNMLIAFLSLFVNGFGVYLTIHADIGSGPWDVLNLGISGSTGMIYGNASILVSLLVLCMDILMKEPIGVAMIIDSLTVGKSVDFFNWIHVIPAPKNLPDSILMLLFGLTVMGVTQFFYMRASIGCGPRDTLIVGLTRHIKVLPIAVITIMLQGFVTLIGWLLGGPVGIGTILCAFCGGPIMQLAFLCFRFDATKVKHQNIIETVKLFAERSKRTA